MTGITISDGKYAYVRGVGDRYNNTLLNGASLPSTDPEKKSFSYDIIPAGMVENLITAKTFTPDKPGDFTGGLVQISTIEFPSKFTLTLNSTAGYNSNSTFNPFTTYAGGKTDWLGSDDGTRSLPGTINDTRVVRGNYTNEQLQDIGLSFKNNWQTQGTTAPINGSINWLSVTGMIWVMICSDISVRLITQAEPPFMTDKKTFMISLALVTFITV